MKKSEIKWITSGSNLNDYRPAVGPDGDTTVFERALIDSGEPVALYVLAGIASPAPYPFLPDLKGAQTRPDWCWATGVIAFNVSVGKTAEDTSVWTVASNGGQSTAIPGTNAYLYPQWSADVGRLAVMNNGGTAYPNPCTTVIDASGKILKANINGITEQNDTAVFGGMPSAAG